jgi:hypothetical protein
MRLTQCTYQCIQPSIEHEIIGLHSGRAVRIQWIHITRQSIDNWVISTETLICKIEIHCEEEVIPNVHVMSNIEPCLSLRSDVSISTLTAHEHWLKSTSAFSLRKRNALSNWSRLSEWWHKLRQLSTTKREWQWTKMNKIYLWSNENEMHRMLYRFTYKITQKWIQQNIESASMLEQQRIDA